MKGKDCVAIAADRRFGVQALTLSTDFQKIFKMTDKTFIGLAGLATDVQTMYFFKSKHAHRSEKLRFRVNMYRMREEREIETKTFAHMVSSALYERRSVFKNSFFRFGPYFTEPVIAGLQKDGEPFICSMDYIGCINFAKDFVVAGTASTQLYGMCESLWEPEMVFIKQTKKRALGSRSAL